MFKRFFCRFRVYKKNGKWFAEKRNWYWWERVPQYKTTLPDGLETKQEALDLIFQRERDRKIREEENKKTEMDYR